MFEMLIFWLLKVDFCFCGENILYYYGIIKENYIRNIWCGCKREYRRIWNGFVWGYRRCEGLV